MFKSNKGSVKCSGVFYRPSISDIAEIRRGVHLPCSEERTFATDPPPQRQQHLPADTTGHRHTASPMDSSSSIYSCSS